MSQIRFEHLTPDHVDLLETHTNWWTQIGLSVRTDRLKAERAIRQVYRDAGLAEPIHFIWARDPVEATLALWKRTSHTRPLQGDPAEDLFHQNTLKQQITKTLLAEVQEPLQRQVSANVLQWVRRHLESHLQERVVRTWLPVWNQVRQELHHSARQETLARAQTHFWQPIWEQSWQDQRHHWATWLLETTGGLLWQGLQDQPWIQELEDGWLTLWLQLSEHLYDLAFRAEDVLWLSPYSYLQEVAGLDLQPLNGLLAACQYCGCWWPSHYWVIVCPKPTVLRFDPAGRLHAEGRPAVRFCDSDFEVFAWHGVNIPSRYGQIPSERWSVEWLLQEHNAELRRVLLQGIGYGRLVQELKPQILDTWREYQLLRITQEIDVEPIHLLKMVCPSTQYVHILRVPPHLETARQAVQWCNWDVDPVYFEQET